MYSTLIGTAKRAALQRRQAAKREMHHRTVSLRGATDTVGEHCCGSDLYGKTRAVARFKRAKRVNVEEAFQMADGKGLCCYYNYQTLSGGNMDGHGF